MEVVFFIIIGSCIFASFVFTMLMSFSPKFKAKFMSHQFQAVKHMTNYSKQDKRFLQKIKSLINDFMN